MGVNIDARGKEQAGSIFDFHMNRATEERPIVYTLWMGSKLKHTSEEIDPEQAKAEFNAILDAMQKSKTMSVAEVRFHDVGNGQPNKGNIVSSMTFKVNDEEYKPVEQQQGSQSNFNKFIEEYMAMKNFEAAIAPSEDNSAVGSDTVSVFDRITEILQIPIVEETIGAIGRKMGLDIPDNNGEAYAVAGEAVEAKTDESFKVSMDNDERMEAVLKRLGNGEKDLIGLLEKLADLKENEPMKYKMAKSML